MNMIEPYYYLETHVMEGSGKMVVTAVGVNSYLYNAKAIVTL